MVHAMSSSAALEPRWPALPLEAWLPTCETLHRWTQIVGKTRLALAPFENHWWNAALRVSAHGLGTGALPFARGLVEIEFDFLAAELTLRTSDGEVRQLRLENRSVADFYREYRARLDELGVGVHIVGTPNELPDATPFADDHDHATFDADAARTWWLALTQADRLLKQFRSGFGGKCSPSHFWWGSFDLSCTRFSGREAPAYPGKAPNTPDYVMREAYSHECISAGWWPGTADTPVTEAAFYAYAYPEPAGCAAAAIGPGGAFYHADMREWILPYESVRASGDPDAMVMEFLESTYTAAATLGHWDVAALRSAHDALPRGSTRSHAESGRNS